MYCSVGLLSKAHRVAQIALQVKADNTADVFATAATNNSLMPNRHPCTLSNFQSDSPKRHSSAHPASSIPQPSPKPSTPTTHPASKMDAESLPDLAHLLTGKVNASTRAATCAALAASSSGPTGASLRHLVGTTTSGTQILNRLLTLCAEPICARLALSALVNMSEDEGVAARMVTTGGVQRVARALLDDDQRMLHSLYAGLLSNLTRYGAGVDALVGRGGDQVSDISAFGVLMGLVSRLNRIPNVLWMANICVSEEGRKALLEGEHCPLNNLLKLGGEKDEATRLAAASAVRNCCLADEWHEALVKRSEAIEFCLRRLKKDQRHVHGELAHGDAKATEPVVEIRVVLAEALLLLCKSQQGRESLRRRDAYTALEEWQKFEDSQEVSRAVDSILDRIVAIEGTDAVDETSLPSGISAVETLD